MISFTMSIGYFPNTARFCWSSPRCSSHAHCSLAVKGRICLDPICMSGFDRWRFLIICTAREVGTSTHVEFCQKFFQLELFQYEHCLDNSTSRSHLSQRSLLQTSKGLRTPLHMLLDVPLYLCLLGAEQVIHRCTAVKDGLSKRKKTDTSILQSFDRDVSHITSSHPA